MIDGGLTPYETGSLLNEEMYNQAVEEYGNEIKVGMGAEAIKELLMSIDLEKSGYNEFLRKKRKQIENKKKLLAI